MKKTMFCLSLALSACGNQLALKVDLNCPQIKGIDALLAEDMPRLVIFGEIHGTKEVPVFIGDVVCRALELGHPTILALEFPPNGRDDLNTYISEPIEEKAQKNLLKTSYWYGGGQDGKKSKAIFQLIKRSKSYIDRELNLRLEVFDVSHEFVEKNRKLSRTKFQLNRERKMAENLHNMLNSYPESKIIVLTGNYHSAKWHNGNDTMASFLPSDQFITLNLNAGPGTAWTWAKSVTKVGGKINPAFMVNGQASKERAIYMFPDKTKHHDGLYYTITKTVSKPTHD